MNAKSLVNNYAQALDDLLGEDEETDGFNDASMRLHDAKTALNEFARDNDVQVSCDVDFPNGSTRNMTGRLLTVNCDDCYFESAIGNVAGAFSTMELE